MGEMKQQRNNKFIHVLPKTHFGKHFCILSKFLCEIVCFSYLQILLYIILSYGF